MLHRNDFLITDTKGVIYREDGQCGQYCAFVVVVVSEETGSFA